ncbi:MAG: hypothetical protein K8S16_08075 [Bacteroidales bacterium]|nr:hypothetical protein [Bacteroidales bacterium]
MTRIKKLDKILNGLLFIDMKLLNEESISKKVTIEFLSKTLELDCEKWELKSLKNELLEEAFIIEKNGELRITEKGKRFSTHLKGYRNQDKIQVEEEVIREKTIEKFKYDKIGFWLSIIAIVIAGLSFYFSIFN